MLKQKLNNFGSIIIIVIKIGTDLYCTTFQLIVCFNQPFTNCPVLDKAANAEVILANFLSATSTLKTFSTITQQAIKPIEWNTKSYSEIERMLAIRLARRAGALAATSRNSSLEAADALRRSFNCKSSFEVQRPSDSMTLDK